MAPVTAATARVGLDIGATKTQGVAATPDGVVLAEVLATTPTGGDDVVAVAAGVVAELRARLGADLDGVVGVGVPGLVDAASGSVKHAVNLGVDDWFPIAERLAERTGTRVVVDNDVNAAALGAAQVTGHHDLVYLSLGTGLAAASILDGRLRRGFRSAAGEIGHVPVDPGGRPCQCGQVGCLETAASGSAVAEAWPVEGVAPAQALFDAAAAGDPRAMGIRDRFAARVADAVRLVCLTVDPEFVVLGGGVAQVGERLRVSVAHALAEQASSSPFLRSLDLPGRVLLVPSGVPVAALGAALLPSAET
ncbi:ROK family protein [Nocardioides bizhenqiangii]|uniref:ROK family protein n=1 Tax=Nocardioides bizhenqiangii TaxID=3095076 RepID=A0ABZ0ZW24_9ACTN|nr:MULTISPECIES: ROK family protein [unclassified Nocardioides]MDZ5621843.1 ROK family protein [Nocardioides sp. HM23]WQQ27473.1 ROK family protein [Nocardioides sp. HM61]